METIETVDDRLSEAFEKIQRAIETENALPPPNAVRAAFFNAVLLSLPVLGALYSVYQLYECIDLFPMPEPGRSPALARALAQESFTCFVAGMVTFGSALAWWAFGIKRRVLEDLCTDERHQQAFYDYLDDRPRAPEDLRNAARELRLAWPAGQTEPRLILTFLREADWMGAPPHVRWSLEHPGSGEQTILPPATRQRSYALGQF